MKTTHWVFILFCFIFSETTLAKWIQYKPLTMSVSAKDKLEIKGFKGKLFIKAASNKDQHLKITVRQNQPSNSSVDFDEWNFSFIKEGDVIKATIESPQSLNSWNKVLLSQNIPEYEMQIISPSIPLNISWKEGSVTLNGWGAKAHILHGKGSVKVSESKADIAVHNQKGSFSVEKHEGGLRVETVSGKLSLKNIKGDIVAESYSGKAEIKAIEGNLSLSSFKGGTVVSGVKGQVDFKNGNSEIKLSEIEGSIRGTSGQGTVVAKLSAEADMRVRTKEGSVHLRAPGSGAWANFGTEEGTLYVPSFLKLTRLPTLKVRQGRLRGSKTGKIFVRTESGNIRLK